MQLSDFIFLIFFGKLKSENNDSVLDMAISFLPECSV